MSTITFESPAYKSLKDQLDAMQTMLKVVCARASVSKWVFEDEAMLLTGLKHKSLWKLRATDVIRSRTVTGRKIQYLRSDINAYTDGIPRPAKPYVAKKKVKAEIAC